MRILIHHPVMLPPKNYGGVERVALWLARGLKELGHEVGIAALRGSMLDPAIELIPIENPGPESFEIPEIQKFDLIHFMAPPSQEVISRLPIPYLVTIHGNGQNGEVFPQNSVFLSQNHAKRHGSSNFVYNGIDPNEVEFNANRRTKENAFLFLSRTHWRVKNLRGAIDFCERADVPLTIAGGSRPWILRARLSFSRMLGRSKTQWVGPVVGQSKAFVFGQARALLFPVLWDEPFGLVVIESLMSGTPVLAANRGSLPELVPPACGKIVSSDEEWIESLKSFDDSYEPKECRDWAIASFHYSVMAKNYEKLYIKACSQPINESNPRTIEEVKQ